MRSTRAFTLLELLTVIAIIGVLAAMLLSVLSRAKNNASKATDLNNLREIMSAVYIYAGDEHDVLPWPNWDNGDGNRPGWLYTPDPTLTGPARYKLEAGLLWGTLRNPKVYLCPLDKPHEAHFSEHAGQVVERQQQISSYVINGAIIGYGVLETPVKLGAMLPSDCAFWETDEREPFNYNDGSSSPEEGVSARHAQGGIQAVFDGSVNYIRFEEWYRQVAEPNKNRLWCYPDAPNGR
jgi:prepilin-type N-terminal cleavage/methylation domain-containing protein